MKLCPLFPLLLALVSVGCHAQVVRYDGGNGRPGYNIACRDSFERCESEARDLCPDGFETMSSSHRSKLDTPLLSSRADDEYTLNIECDEKPTKADGGGHSGQ
jgi:hypothetical protein